MTFSAAASRRSSLLVKHAMPLKHKLQSIDWLNLVCQLCYSSGLCCIHCRTWPQQLNRVGWAEEIFFFYVFNYWLTGTKSLQVLLASRVRLQGRSYYSKRGGNHGKCKVRLYRQLQVIHHALNHVSGWCGLMVENERAFQMCHMMAEEIWLRPFWSEHLLAPRPIYSSHFLSKSFFPSYPLNWSKCSSVCALEGCMGWLLKTCSIFALVRLSHHPKICLPVRVIQRRHLSN